MIISETPQKIPEVDRNASKIALLILPRFPSEIPPRISFTTAPKIHFGIHPRVAPRMYLKVFFYKEFLLLF